MTTKKMYKYTMEINGEEYKALFESRAEANSFIRENVLENAFVIVWDIKRVSAVDILKDSDFKRNYQIEMAAMALGLDTLHHKTFELEDTLKALGYIG